MFNLNTLYHPCFIFGFFSLIFNCCNSSIYFELSIFLSFSTFNSSSFGKTNQPTGFFFFHLLKFVSCFELNFPEHIHCFFFLFLLFFFVCFYFSLCSCVFTFWWVQLSLWVSCWAENEIRIQIFSFGRSLHKVESQRQVMIFAFWRISTPWCWYAFHKRIIIYKEFCF